MDNLAFPCVKEENGQVTEVPYNEKYPILAYGKRFKKDSRRWLHKTTCKDEHPIDDDNKVEHTMIDDHIDTKDNCNGTNYRKNVSYLRSFLKRNSNNPLIGAKPVKSCIRNINIEDSGDMFRRKNKRRSKSPIIGNGYNVRFDGSADVDNKIRHFHEMSKTFKPIKRGYHLNEMLDVTCDDSSNDSLDSYSSINLIRNGEEGNDWRQTKSVSSDESTTPTGEASFFQTHVPIKRSKCQMTEISDGRLSLVSTPTDSILDLDETSCTTPWLSMSLEDNILHNCTVQKSVGKTKSSYNRTHSS